VGSAPLRVLGNCWKCGGEYPTRVVAKRAQRLLSSIVSSMSVGRGCIPDAVCCTSTEMFGFGQLSHCAAAPRGSSTYVVRTSGTNTDSRCFTGSLQEQRCGPPDAPRGHADVLAV
jgi:hypothetical protein